MREICVKTVVVIGIVFGPEVLVELCFYFFFHSGHSPHILKLKAFEKVIQSTLCKLNPRMERFRILSCIKQRD